LVAVGNLDKVWIAVPEDATAKELQNTFQDYFGAQWGEVLNAADNSFPYNSANNAYFSVRNLRPLENLTVAQILEEKGNNTTRNIIVS
jgi:hypothetical protein